MASCLTAQGNCDVHDRSSIDDEENRSHPKYSTLTEVLKARDNGQEVPIDHLNQLANQSQGPLESQFYFGDESVLHKFYNTCGKNPGHKDFVLHDDLDLEHLPEVHKNQEYLEYIHCKAALTVKLTTFFMSSNRPDTWEARGQHISQKATGFVSEVTAVKARERYNRSKYKRNPSKTNDWYRLFIVTASHVVFDQSEANKIQIDFSYYTNINGKRVKLERSLTRGCQYSHQEGYDTCVLVLSTKDEGLCSHLRQCRQKIVEYPHIFSQYVAIVSHPHGREKHISFGTVRTWYEVDEETRSLSCRDTYERRSSFADLDSPFLEPFERCSLLLRALSYTTATCPGSSGALVLLDPGCDPMRIFSHSGTDVLNTSGKSNLSGFDSIAVPKNEFPRNHLKFAEHSKGASLSFVIGSEDRKNPISFGILPQWYWR